MDQLTAVADEACKETERKLSDYYDEYCERTSLPKKTSQVYSLEDYLKRLRSRGIDPAQCIGQAFKTYEHLELRMRCFKAVEELQNSILSREPKSLFSMRRLIFRTII